MLHYLKRRVHPNLLGQAVYPDPQIFDLLQLSRQERECRAVCQRTIRALHVWKKRQGAGGHRPLGLYLRVEGVMLRRHAQDAVFLYRLVRKEREKLFHDYMNRLPERSAMLGKA